MRLDAAAAGIVAKPEAFEQKLPFLKANQAAAASRTMAEPRTIAADLRPQDRRSVGAAARSTAASTARLFITQWLPGTPTR